jgi:hypothetical protein
MLADYRPRGLEKSSGLKSEELENEMGRFNFSKLNNEKGNERIRLKNSNWFAFIEIIDDYMPSGCGKRFKGKTQNVSQKCSSILQI